MTEEGEPAPEAEPEAAPEPPPTDAEASVRPQQEEGDAEATEPQPEEVLSMGKYLGVAVERGEAYLLSVAREAVVAPVLSPWQEMEDAQGNPYFFNHNTKESTRRHPLDTKFLHLVAEMRQQASTAPEEELMAKTWMKFGVEGTEPYYYNFVDGSKAPELPEAAVEIPPIPPTLMPVYDSHTFGTTLEFPGGVPSTTRRLQPDTMSRDGVLRELTFKSWWSEDNEEPTRLHCSAGLKKRYMTIKFDIYAQTFEINIDNEESVSLYNLMSVTAKNGFPIQCWDLHVGAKLNMLGKTTTLMQGNFETLAWLEKHTKRLLAIKEALQADLSKYETRPLAAAVTYTKGPKTAGGTSLRALMEQIEKLAATLAQFRPTLARKYAMQAAKPP